MKIFWGINVYNRMEHLALQAKLLRKHFGEQVYIYVFCNHENLSVPLGDYDEICQFTSNGGHHQGCLDAYNHILPHEQRPASDVVVWTHADSVFMDYAIAESYLFGLVAGGDGIVTIGETSRVNPRHREQGVVPWAYNDFFAMRPPAYDLVFPVEDRQFETGDLYDPVEVVLGRAMEKSGLKRRTITSVYDWHTRPHCFRYSDQCILSCDNDIEQLREVLKRESSYGDLV